jgi:hypothetical protein
MEKSMKKTILFFICITGFLYGDMPEPYRSVVLLPYDGHGWFGNADPLGEILESKKPNVVIEVGSWLGCSTRFIASNIPEGAVLYAIDTWKGTPGESVHMQDPRLPCLFQIFLSNVIHAGLTDKIIPVRMDSVEASRGLRIKADLIYLDGAHDTESVTRDIEAWLPHLNEGGIMCGDDWSWDTVRVAVINCAEKHEKQVHVVGNFWVFVD